MNVCMTSNISDQIIVPQYLVNETYIHVRSFEKNYYRILVEILSLTENANSKLFLEYLLQGLQPVLELSGCHYLELNTSTLPKGGPLDV